MEAAWPGTTKPDPTAAEDAELARRLRSLDRQLGAERDADQGPPGTTAGRSLPGMARGMRLATDFIAGIVLGAALGWGFDQLFHTSPWGLIVWVILGFIAGTLNMVRSAGLVKPGPFGPGPDDRPGG